MQKVDNFVMIDLGKSQDFILKICMNKRIESSQTEKRYIFFFFLKYCGVNILSSVALHVSYGEVDENGRFKNCIHCVYNCE